MQISLTKRHKEYSGGALMFALGLWAVLQGATYQVGTLEDMGPGFFPVAVGALLALSGCTTVWLATRIPADKREAVPPAPEWRGWICIVASLVAFVVLGSTLGLLAATFATVFIAALGDRHNTARNAFLLAASVCVIAVVVFWWALKIQLPLFQWNWSWN
jgi:hypothetical protein